MPTDGTNPRYYHKLGLKPPKVGRIHYYADRQTYCAWVETWLTNDAKLCVVKFDNFADACAHVEHWQRVEFRPPNKVVMAEAVRQQIFEDKGDV